MRGWCFLIRTKKIAIERKIMYKMFNLVVIELPKKKRTENNLAQSTFITPKAHSTHQPCECVLTIGILTVYHCCNIEVNTFLFSLKSWILENWRLKQPFNMKDITPHVVSELLLPVEFISLFFSFYFCFW